MEEGKGKEISRMANLRYIYIYIFVCSVFGYRFLYGTCSTLLHSYVAILHTFYMYNHISRDSS